MKKRFLAMGKEKGLKDKLAATFYDKPKLNKTALTLKKSLDEVNGLLNNKNKKK